MPIFSNIRMATGSNDLLVDLGWNIEKDYKNVNTYNLLY